MRLTQQLREYQRQCWVCKQSKKCWIVWVRVEERALHVVDDCCAAVLLLSDFKANETLDQRVRVVLKVRIEDIRFEEGREVAREAGCHLALVPCNIVKKLRK
jgi:hypothetical protein